LLLPTFPSQHRYHFVVKTIRGLSLNKDVTTPRCCLCYPRGNLLFQ